MHSITSFLGARARWQGMNVVPILQQFLHQGARSATVLHRGIMTIDMVFDMSFTWF